MLLLTLIMAVSACSCGTLTNYSAAKPELPCQEYDNPPHHSTETQGLTCCCTIIGCGAPH